jgi:hypothetical protein
MLCFNKSVTVSVYTFNIMYNKEIQFLLFFESKSIYFIMKSSLIIILYFLFIAYDNGDWFLLKELLDLKSALTSFVVKNNFKMMVWSLIAAYDSKIRLYIIFSTSELTFSVTRSSLTTISWLYITINESDVCSSLFFELSLTLY